MSYRVYIETSGCAVNRFYSEVIAGKLIRQGFELTSDPGKADLIILNACSIKKPTEERMLERAKSLYRYPGRLVVVGCLVNTSLNKLRRMLPLASFFDVNNFLSIDNYADRLVKGERVEVLGSSSNNVVPLLQARRLENPLIAVVPISRGCLGSCTYCVDRLIWGHLKSYPIDMIVSEIKRLVDMGAKEIRLSGQDTGPYGWDIGSNLAELLNEISEIPGDFRIRIGMASPDTIVRHIDDVLDVIKSDKRFYRYLHIPVQSGSNRILKLMRRKYEADLFRDLVKTVRCKLGEDSTIATDIISSFPTETEEDHEATMQLLKDTQPDIVNLSRYGDRPGVPASKIYPKVHSRISKRRTRELAELIRQISYSRNRRYLGKSMSVLFLETRNGAILGRTHNYRLVALKDHSLTPGFTSLVRIIDATWKTLYGALEEKA